MFKATLKLVDGLVTLRRDGTVHIVSGNDKHEYEQPTISYDRAGNLHINDTVVTPVVNQAVKFRNFVRLAAERGCKVTP